MSAAMAALEGIQALRHNGPEVCPLQDYFADKLEPAEA